MEPTRADMVSQTAWLGRRLSLSLGLVEGESLEDFLGRKGVKCLVRRRGPMVLTAKVLVSWEWESWVGDFSG